MEDSGRKMGIVTDARYVHTQTASIQKTYKKVSRRIQILYRSRLYYHRKYSRIGMLKYILLAAAGLAAAYSAFPVVFHNYYRKTGKFTD